ncbi:tripartite tricarboxylate transporter TctB family protein [Bacillus sp. FJAT-44742]|uniref:tripartite tricarboxylate transporter TctB family protein n=1 Tax=Bacillus sp. FJAT-44742 TaxID=2014005 RepID=UPI000C238763|nr:tripartite tricarboxylate transporter TctB family protein [Bacillus sp. FJAT-44742]
MRKTTVSLIFIGFIFIGCIWFIIESFSFQDTARYFPMTVASIGAIISLIVFIQTLIHHVKTKEETLFHQQFGEVLKYAGWLIGYILLITIIGFIPSTVIYLIAFLYFVTRMKLLQIAVSVGGTLAFLFVLGEFVELKWPGGILFFM